MSAKNYKIALLGPAKTFSDIAADKFIKSSKKSFQKYFAKSIDECFEMVEKGITDCAIVPVENKLNGTVREVLDNLFYKKIHITAEVLLPVHHCLIVLKSAKAKDIKTIASHSQALSQCKKYLKKNFPKVSLEAFSSTSLALQKLLSLQDESLAVIASQEAAKLSGIKIFAKNIEDESWNSTTFLVIEKGDFVLPKPSKAEQKSRTRLSSKLKTSIAFYFKKDQPGSLFSVFKIFADKKINLSKIESRPSRSEFGGYIFYVDFEGGASPGSSGLSALNSLQKIVARLKIFGSY
jgi:prephenate dehydratase